MLLQAHQRFLLISVILIIILNVSNAWVSENKIIESDLLQNYDRKHRPVKSESTTMKIQVFLMINHIEKVVKVNYFLLLNKT